MSRPGKEHWEGVKRVLRYIQATINYGLMFQANGNEDTLVGYSDADWAGDINTRRSTSGYVFQVYGSTVSWCSRGNYLCPNHQLKQNILHLVWQRKKLFG